MFDELITLNEADFSVSFSTLPGNILGDLPMFFSVEPLHMTYDKLSASRQN